MSRNGKHPVPLPGGVGVALAEGRLTAKGPNGELTAALMDEVVVSEEDGAIVVRPRDESLRSRAMWGTARTVVANVLPRLSLARYASVHWSLALH